MLFSFSRAAFILAALSVPAPAFAFTAAPGSEIIQIAAITFQPRAVVSLVGDDNSGTLTAAQGKFYAAVPFPTNGLRVCRFILVHRDNDADGGVEARLLKKKVLVGSNAFESPLEMAKAKTTAGQTTMFVAVKTDASITEPVLDLANNFYYVELTVANQFIEVLGVQIEVNSSCR